MMRRRRLWTRCPMRAYNESVDPLHPLLSTPSFCRTWSQRFNNAQTLQLVMAEQMSEERSKAIEQVAESVNELAGIFKEIHVLVIDQGTILDRIDFNIELAADKVGTASSHLELAGCLTPLRMAAGHGGHR